MTGLVVARARAHRLLLAAALLTVLLTTAVLATLAAYSGAIGDAALRHSLNDPRNAADTALIVKAEAPAGGRTAADTAVRKGAEATFPRLPVTVRTLVRSGPYALPRQSRAAGDGPSASSGDPDLTYFAALDTTQVRLVSGRLPRRTAHGVEVALPQAAAQPLRLKPGAALTLTDRLDGPPVRIRVTGLYRPASPTAPYWQLDDLLGRGVKTSGFTTYGPLLTAPSVLAGHTVSAGASAWLASADFATVTTGRIGALRSAAREGSAALRKPAALSGVTTSATSLPDVLDRLDRALLVSRSTILIIALQLVLLAGYALLLVARLLSAERAGETRLLRARGGSRARIAGLAAAEALLLALPAALCAPLLAGPLTGLLAEQGALARIGLHLDVSRSGHTTVWAVAAGVALGCALAVTVPALTDGAGAGAGDGRARSGRDRSGKVRTRSADGPGVRPARARSGRGSPPARPRGRFTVGSGAGRAGTLPGPVRAGADVGLLVVAGVAYWQLNRQTSGAVRAGLPQAPGSADAGGAVLGIDPLLVAAPALALLAGTVLTLRLLPPVARLAERRAAAGRGLPMALAGWQFSRRPMRGAGPVLLLVLAVALGMLAIGQGASWDRSQDDQADFRAGAPVRVLAAGDGGLGRTETYAALPHVREAVPAVRTAQPLSGDRTATVLALDTAHAADAVLMRPDLAPVRPLLAGLTPRPSPAGARVPAGTARLRLTAAVRSSTGPGTTIDVTVTLQDQYGVPYQMSLGQLPTDGRPHALTLDLASPPGPSLLTGLQLDMPQPAYRAERHRFTVSELTATGADGTVRRISLAAPVSWAAAARASGTVSPNAATNPTRPRLSTSGPLTVDYGTGYLPAKDVWTVASVAVALKVVQPAAPEVTAVATDRFLASAGAHTGQRVEVTYDGESLPVRIVRSVPALPTTAAPAGSGEDAGEDDGGAVLVDLRAVNRALQARYDASATPTEWWLDTAPGDASAVAAAVRALPDVGPGQVVVRDEIAAELRDDPFGAGPEAAFAAAAVVAAALAAVGFAVSAAGSLRERRAEFAVLRALGAPRRRLARTIATEQGVLVGLALLVGVGLGTVLTRAVLPLIVLTAEATRPVPKLLVELPPGRVALLLAAVAATPLIVTAALALRRADPVGALRDQGGE
ncbi:ABC transporter permease [Streptomyces sp. NPDC046805]|uniref:ABC transporter permease n=1 Tax=Streptomyces sp. NPDC046805 TaxID=3155134 RepID=UPI0033D52B2B